MEEVIETDKFYLSNPFFVPKSPSNELKIISEGHVKLDEIKAENTVSFKIEPNTSPNGTETSIIIDPVAKNDFKGRFDLKVKPGLGSLAQAVRVR